MTIETEINKNSDQLLKQLAKLSESELTALIRYHNRQYFVENTPLITDEAFDKLVEALRFINEHAEVLMEIGHKVVAEKSMTTSITHDEPMLSLEKCYDDTAFSKWAQKIDGGIIAMPKIDGVACSIHYSESGSLLSITTRGDGKVGENITKNAMLIKDIPKGVAPNNSAKAFNVRGEVFLPLSVFKNNFAEEFASPRNLAAGFLKLKNADEKKCQLLRFFPYDIRGLSLESEQEKFEALDKWGFFMMPWFLTHDENEAKSLYLKFLKNREGYDFEMDGVVFRANSIATQKRLGETAHHPRYAIAYKFHTDSASTKLLGIEWSVARSGIITPVALVEPVFVSGASIQRASLHNLGIFLSHDFREESLVEINRRGGVIPHVERVLSSKGKKLLPPTHCPSCNGEVFVDGDFLRCKNPETCSTVAVSKLVHFCHVVGIEGMGEKIIQKLYDAGLVKQPGDFFRLTKENLLLIDRMGDVLAEKLIDEINLKRSMSLNIFLKSLGIREIGSNISELLANNWPTLDQILRLEKEDLVAVHGIGESIASSLISGLKENSASIEDLLSQITISAKQDSLDNKNTSHPLFGKSVLFTGKMAHLERKSAQEAVKQLGGKTPDAMSKHIDYLVIGDEGSALLGEGAKSTKQKQAEKIITQGGLIKIISETEFLALIKNI